MIIPRIKNFTTGMQFFKRFTTSEQIYAARPRIKHYIVSRDQFSDYDSILKEIEDVVNASRDSIIFLTQKSRVVVTAKLDPEKPGRPATLEEIERELSRFSIKTILKNQNIIPLFLPEPGHVCLTLTDDFGNSEEFNTVSLRPDMDRKRIVSGKTMLYKHLYGEFTGALFHSQNTTFDAEAKKLAKLIANKHSTIVADITVVPFSSSNVSREQLMEGIGKARATPLYNLCKTIFKEKLLQNNDDLSIKACLNEMKNVAALLGLKDTKMSESDEVILAAFACTNAAVEACFGDPHYLAKNIGMDLSTQATVTLCCAMNLVGEEEFFRFASSFGFYDESVALIEGLDSDKIRSMKK